MKFFLNLSIRDKLLVCFLLFFVVFAGFTVYFLLRLDKINTSFEVLTKQSQKLQLFLKLDSDNRQLSESVKSFILTRDPRWETVYDTTSADFSQTLQTLKSLSEPDEVSKLATFENITTQLYGTELLIFAKTKEGDTQKAIMLFDNNYQQKQQESSQLIGDLVKGEDVDFNTTLDQDNSTLDISRNILVTASGLILIFILLLASFISSFFERSIRNFINRANDLASGNLQTRMLVTSHDELGKLAATFNNMAEKLQASYNDLEQRIKQRTEELEKAKVGLEEQVSERTKELEASKTDLETQVAKRTQELQQKLSELEVINAAMVNRELKMVELKNEIAKLKGVAS